MRSGSRPHRRSQAKNGCRGPYPVITNAATLARSLRDLSSGDSPIAHVPTSVAPGGRVALDVFPPHQIWDRLLLSGVSAKVWLKPGGECHPGAVGGGIGATRPRDDARHVSRPRRRQHHLDRRAGHPVRADRAQSRRDPQTEPPRLGRDVRRDQRRPATPPVRARLRGGRQGAVSRSARISSITRMWRMSTSPEARQVTTPSSSAPARKARPVAGPAYRSSARPSPVNSAAYHPPSSSPPGGRPRTSVSRRSTWPPSVCTTAATTASPPRLP